MIALLVPTSRSNPELTGSSTRQNTRGVNTKVANFTRPVARGDPLVLVCLEEIRQNALGAEGPSAATHQVSRV